MGRCTSCGFEPPYPTTTCPQCGGVVSAGSPVAGVTPPAGDAPVADRTMRRSDLTGQAPYAAPPPPPPAAGHDVPGSGGDGPISGVPQWGQTGAVTPPPPPAWGSEPSGDQPPPPPYGASPSTAYPPPPGATAGGAMGAGAQPSDLGSRFLALLIDYVVAWVPLLVISMLTSAIGNRSSILGLLGSLLGFVALVLALAVMIVPMGRTGQTIGGAVMGVKVVDARSGGPIGIGRAFARYLIWALMGAVCYLGYISYFIDKSGYQRGFNDQAADSVAVVGPKLGFSGAVQNAMAAFRS